MQCKTKLCLILFCDQQTGQRQVWFGEVLFFQCLRYSETLRPLRDGNGCNQDVSTTSGWAQYRCFDSAEAARSAAVRQIRVGTRIM